MDFTQLTESRRSVRAYDTSRTVTREQIEKIVYAARQAPSWKNSQTARYYCVISPDKCGEFRDNCLPEGNAKKAEGAALVVSAFARNVSGHNAAGEPDNEVGNGWGYYDLGLADENFCLAAKDMGLDTLIMGLRDEASIRKMLDIPAEEIIVSVIAVGYGATAPSKPPRKATEDILKFY